MAKKPLSTQIPEEVLEEMRRAVVALSGPPDRLTISDFVETAIRRYLARLRMERNRGKFFRNPGRPRTGAQVKSR